MQTNHRQPTDRDTGPSGDPGAPPVDVVTGFWLWVIALPLMMTGYVTAAVFAQSPTPAWIVYTSTAVFAVNTAAVVIVLLILLREGYRWARSLLTGGGAAAVVYTGTNVVGYEGPEVATVVFAMTSIVGAVLIGGGIYLVHRKDVGEFFNR